jgi:hypothetical protein
MTTTIRGRLHCMLVVAGVGATAALSGCGGPSAPTALPNSDAVASARTGTPATRTFKFKTIDNAADPTFNQLLGINDDRTAAGYDGSGNAGHPSQGYTAVPPFKRANFTGENYAGSVQTQVTAINNLGDTAGFWIDTNGVTRGFIDWNGVFTSYENPNAVGTTVILGLNDSGIAAGFYVGSSASRHGFTLDQATGVFTPVAPPEATNVTAAGINDDGDVAGFYSSTSQTIGFLHKGGTFSSVSYPGATATTARGINIHDAIVGGYIDASGNHHGFLLLDPLKAPQWRSIDDPKGIGTTTINGVNDRVNMVGFYVDSVGNTDGMLIERKR